ncbi:MAG: hypothetical protein U5R46_17700 [Gammaproteobacteria bacterium]|nr:hypothetical protein [Gammaproteobacteria bacterium]
MREQACVRLPDTTPLIIALALLVLHSLTPAVADSRDCDCSCEALSEFESALRQQGGDSMSPEVAAVMNCYAPCLQQWQQCQAQQQAEADGPKWDCDNKPNSPVEREEWQRECGTDEDTGFWASRLGEPRDDLGRFYGRYEGAEIDWIVAPAEASMEMQDQGRGQIPPGYMMIHAARGDVAPWYMKSTGDARFEAKTVSGGEVIAEFQLGPDNAASEMILNSPYQDGVRYIRTSEGEGQHASSGGSGSEQSGNGDDLAGEAANEIDRNRDDPVKEKINDAFESVFGD